jgi:hypothetical protein
MPLPQKQSLAINFAASIDQQTDPLQLQVTDFASLVNCVYTKNKQLTKRNGFAPLTLLPEDYDALALSTFKGNLTVLGDSILAYNAASSTWVDRGRYQGCELSVISLSADSYSKQNVDAVTASNGWTLSTFENITDVYVYQVHDSVTSQLLVSPTALPTGALSVKTGTIGNLFFITYMIDNGGTPNLRCIKLPFATLAPEAPFTISAQVSDEADGYDFVVFENSVYIAWSGSDVGDSVRMLRMTDTLAMTPSSIIGTGQVANLLSICADTTGTWVSWYQTSDTSVHSTKRALLTNAELVAAAEMDDTNALTQIGSISDASDGSMTLLMEVENEYTFDAIRTDYITSISRSSAGTTGSLSTVVRSVGLASKPFWYEDHYYFLGIQESNLQSTYFLIDENGDTVCKLSYGNGGTYITGVVLPSVTVQGSVASIATQVKTLISATATDAIGGINVYSQYGVNYASFDLAPSKVSSVEMAEVLHLSGGFVWMYDGAQVVEHNFHLFPENLFLTAGADGSMPEQEYRYVALYEWTDAQGNIHRSAPSLPSTITLGAGEDSVAVEIPTARLTYKTDARIVVYRWSVAQQTYHQVTSITTPVLNDPTVDSVTFTDGFGDASLAANPILYTTGGVIENIAFPATHSLANFKNRLVALSSENRNNIVASKVNTESTPVQPTDLFTIYVSPASGAASGQGPTTILTVLDDKLIAFKDDSAFYVVGDGPNDLGTGGGFSVPTFIPSTVGCDNQASLALIPQGLMFQSDKGIWLLDRGLNTSFIGSRVLDEGLLPITSANTIPNTNEVRFTRADGTALMYDYYYDRWATFDNLPATASTLYQQLHTYLTPQGQVRQESPGEYLDGTTPVTIKFETAWMNLAGLQALERVYQLFLIGTYASPHTLALQVSYDYEPSPTQSEVITPVPFAGNWGSSPNFWGQGETWGGAGNKEQERVFFARQKVQALKVFVQERFDPSQGTSPGAGLTLSGLNFVVGFKKSSPTLPAKRSF